MIPPRQVRLDTMTTTKRELALDTLLAEDSTFYGDLFPHAVQWKGELYLEDGLHRWSPAPDKGPACPPRLAGSGGGPLEGGRQSQPFSSATRAASTRVRAPVLPIAEDR